MKIRNLAQVFNPTSRIEKISQMATDVYSRSTSTSNILSLDNHDDQENVILHSSLASKENNLNLYLNNETKEKGKGTAAAVIQDTHSNPKRDGRNLPKKNTDTDADNTDSYNEIEYEVEFEEQSIGLTFNKDSKTGSMIVRDYVGNELELMEGSVKADDIWCTPKLKGALVVGVNEEIVEHLNYKQVQEKLKNAGRPLQLRLREICFQTSTSTN